MTYAPGTLLCLEFLTSPTALVPPVTTWETWKSPRLNMGDVVIIIETLEPRYNALAVSRLGICVIDTDGFVLC